jgi:NAD(P)-dependent dehydrogenase (short-subunit alcohol dehydrogenase family)
MTRLQGSTALVTGTDSDGIGRGIARALAAAGADVALHWYRDRAAAEALSAELGALGRRAPLVHADLADPAAARAMTKAAIASLGSLSIFVSNAGAIQRKAFLDITDGDFDALLAVNLRGAFAAAQEAARAMVAAGAGGRIVLITSVNQQHANPNIAHYAASKGGLFMLGRAMALELAPHAITVNMVAPGTIETDINRHMLAEPAFRAAKLAPVPAARAGTPADVAGAVAYLCSAEAAYVTGATITVDGGLTIA